MTIAKYIAVVFFYKNAFFSNNINKYEKLFVFDILNM